MTELKDGINTFYAKSARQWRKWLEKNHESARAVWLILYKKGSGTASINHAEAVEQALCFGWIDSKANKRDEESRYQYFSKRNPKGNWSRINKEKVKKLVSENLMAPAGQAMVETAKKNGCWTALDDVENLIVPADLQKAFARHKKAFSYWSAFSVSARKAILTWIKSAKTTETRLKRITETVTLAKDNLKANQYIKKNS